MCKYADRLYVVVELLAGQCADDGRHVPKSAVAIFFGIVNVQVKFDFELHRRSVDHHLMWCDTLIFVYPTWWSGLPAMLKGWLERVMVPGVAFGFDPDSERVTPRLGHVRRIVGISTYGSPRAYVAAVNDNGRRTLTRALRLCCGRRRRLAKQVPTP